MDTVDVVENKNAFAFEGKEYDAETIVVKCMEDSKHWLEITNAAKAEEFEISRRQRNKMGWKAPERGRFKCNIGISWSKA